MGDQNPYAIVRSGAWIFREVPTPSCPGPPGRLWTTPLRSIFRRSLRHPPQAKSWVLLAWRWSQASRMPNCTGWLLTSDSEMMQYTPQPA
jgi:hypothetical protein